MASVLYAFSLMAEEKTAGGKSDEATNEIGNTARKSDEAPNDVLKFAGFLRLASDQPEGQQASPDHQASKILLTLNESHEGCRELRDMLVGKGSLAIKDLKKLSERSISLAGRKWISDMGGKLSYNDPRDYLVEPSSYSTRSTFRGYYELDIPVAIHEMKIDISTEKERTREFYTLCKLGNHENFVRYICREEKAPFVYIATELCFGSVADLYERRSKDPFKTILGSDILKPKTILFQATKGLDYLHSHRYVHRNVKPSSFLIREVGTPKGVFPNLVIKIAGFRLSRDEGDNSGSIARGGWEAPESKDGPLVKTSLDVFLLGCFFFYVLSAANSREIISDSNRNEFHPFENKRKNIHDEKYPVYRRRDDGWLPKRINPVDVPLLKKMLKFKESERPTLREVLQDSDGFFKPDEFYKIYFDRYVAAGRCVIFNQRKIPNEEDRVGTEKDRDRLKKTFKGLGYEVTTYEDEPSRSIEMKIYELAHEEDWSKYGSLVICFLSHGYEGHILGSDGLPVDIHEMKSMFSGDNCPDLYGKPKIFIVQACRNKLSGGVWLGNFIAKAFDYLVQWGKGLLFWRDDEKKWKPNELLVQQANEHTRPPLLDFLTIYATFPNTVSFLDKSNGTLFIQSLCEALEEEYFGNDNTSKRHLGFVLKQAQIKINKKSDYYNKEFPSDKEFWQTVTCETCLTKNIRFADKRYVKPL